MREACGAFWTLASADWEDRGQSCCGTALTEEKESVAHERLLGWAGSFFGQ